MDYKGKLKEFIVKLLDNIHEQRKLILALSCVVVFVTTYVLILPAFTLEKTEAAKQGGIDVPGVEQAAVADPDGEAEAADEANAAPASKAKEAKTEKAAKESKQTKQNNGSSDITLQNDESEDYVVAVEGKDDVLSEDMSVNVHEIDRSTKKLKKEYDSLYSDALEAVQKEEGSEKPSTFAFAKFYDISLMDGDTETEPADAVDVKISFSEEMQKELKVSDPERLHIVHFAVDKETGKTTPEVLDPETTAITVEKNKVTEAAFTADSFSVFAVVYTVDFHYEVDGKTYDFSIDGGSFISLSQIIEKLEIGGTDENFMSEVENVEFSDPDLVWVGKVEEDTTVGALKEANGLKPEYSANLTKEQIAEEDEKTVKSGDWALISLKPFDTEETLTVTMNNGESWSVLVTDSRNLADIDELHNKADGVTKFVIWTESNGVAYALKRDGSTATIDKNAIDNLGAEFTWTIEYKYNSSDLQYFCVRPSDSDDSSLGLYIHDEYNNPPLVLPGTSEVNIRPKTDGKGGFEVEGWNNTKLVFDTSSKEITSAQGAGVTPVRIKITEQNKSKFSFRVASEDFSMGYVSGVDANNVNQAETAEYVSITKDNANKTNNNRISAVARSPKYLFDYWDLNGTRLSNGSTIEADTLPVTIDGSVLTAHFRRNPDYEATDDEKEGRAVKRELGEWIENLINQQVPLDEDATKKTAEVYDYENRIYRVDLTAKSSMKTFDGIIDLGFSIDWSGSMNFPSKVKQVTGFKESEFSNNYINDIPLGDINSDYWHKTGWLDPSKTYYIITNRTMTADQFRIWYDPNDKEWVQDTWGNWHEMGKWKYSMAYYTENLPDKSTKITPDVRINAADGYLRDLTYAIYEDDSNGRLRRDDLRSSVESTVNHMNSILNKISLAKNAADNPQVKVAWNDFHWKVPESHKSFQSVTEPGAAIDPQVITEGGTRADLGLEDALEFQWEPNSRKYMVLITDGAPQPSSGQRSANQGGWTDEKVQNRTRQYAQQLKNQGITLLTIGLSMSDVKVGSILLYDIASRDSVNEPYFYRADSGDELEYALYEILQTILKDATVIGDVTDTVNPAFYPVDKSTGEALTPSFGQAYYIDLNGNAIRDGNGKPVTSPPQDMAYGKITPSGETYKVEWVNQKFTTDGWQGTIYEKAKEDFLGGNVVKSNQGDAEITSKGYIVDGTDKFVEFNNETKVKGHKQLETPRVNVNELNLSENSTEWTVYLGTEVDPKSEIKALFDKIEVEEVVRSATDTDNNGLPDRIDGENHNYQYMESARDDRQAIGKPQTFLLKDLIDKLPAEEKEKLDWDEIIRLSYYSGDDNTGVSLKYGVYDQNEDNAGTINIKLIKDHDPEKHYTYNTGSPVETYTLVVEFSPEYAHRPVSSGGDGKYPYHTGSYGLKEAGNIAGRDTSTNNHKINVYAKGLHITKVDLNDQTIKGAKFALYRTARNGETDLMDINGGQYHKVAELDTSSTGVAVKEQVEKLPEGEQYYLVETQVPAGYLSIAPIPVNLSLSDVYTPKPGTQTQTTKPETGIYDWVQSAALNLDAEVGVKRTNAENTEDLTHIGTSDTNSDIAYYRITNNPGAKLPSTGGIGTTIFYILGFAIIAASGAGLVIRKRKKSA